MSGAGLPALRELLQTDFLNCPLCDKIYTDPVILPCMHNACEACLQKYASDNSAAGTFQCMVCHTDSPAPANGHGKVKQNHFLAFLCELAACYQTGPKHCEYCSYVNKSVEAISRCIECRDNLCEVCTAAHRRTKLTRGHKVLTFEEISTGNHDCGLRDNQQVTCAVHQTEPVKYFCNGCDLLICRECKVSNHEKHVCLDLDAAAGKYRSQSAALLQHVDGKIPGLVEYSLFLKDYINHVEETKGKLIEDIEKQAEILHKMIDEHKDNMIQQMEAATLQEKNNVAERNAKTEDVTTILKSAVNFVEKLLEHGKHDEVMSLRKVVNERLAQLGRTSIEPMTTKLSLYYSEGTATQSNLEGIFGKVDVFNVPLNDKNVAAMSQNDDSSKLETISIMAAPLPSVGESVQEVMSFESKGSADNKDIWPTGVAVDADGNIIVLDRDNKKVKVFNSTGKLLREFGQNGLQILQCPYDLTVMHSGCIAVTDYEDEDVKVFTPTGAFVKSIRANFKYPRGITTNPQGQLIVVDCHSHRLTVHDPEDGKVIQEIAGKDEDRCDMFTDPYYVVTNNNGYIIVTDWTAPNIKFFDASGKYQANYGTYGNRKDQVLQPYGVCTDKYGYIFVADNQNHRIHLLAPDGKFVRFLVTKQHGLWHPMAVAINNDGQLIVTEALGKVKVFNYV